MIVEILIEIKRKILLKKNKLNYLKFKFLDDYIYSKNDLLSVI